MMDGRSREEWPCFTLACGHEGRREDEAASLYDLRPLSESNPVLVTEVCDVCLGRAEVLVEEAMCSVRWQNKKEWSDDDVGLLVWAVMHVIATE